MPCARSASAARTRSACTCTNGTEYLEGMLAAFKLSAIPVNINYRYVERELEHLYNLTRPRPP